MLISKLPKMCNFRFFVTVIDMAVSAFLYSKNDFWKLITKIKTDSPKWWNRVASTSFNLTGTKLLIEYLLHLFIIFVRKCFHFYKEHGS